MLTVRKISVSRMHSLPNDSYMFRPVMPAKAPFPLHEVEMEAYPCKSQRGTIRVAPAKAVGLTRGGWMGKMPPELRRGRAVALVVLTPLQHCSFVFLSRPRVF